MIYFLLILFFASLSAIIFMIGRKLSILEPQHVLNHEEVLFELPYLKEAKHITVKNVKKHGYKGLVTILRFYIKTTSFLKAKYGQAKIRIKEIGNQKHNNGEKKEISKFLKTVMDYKEKVQEIKHKIKEEENL